MRKRHAIANKCRQMSQHDLTRAARRCGASAGAFRNRDARSARGSVLAKLRRVERYDAIFHCHEDLRI